MITRQGSKASNRILDSSRRFKSSSRWHFADRETSPSPTRASSKLTDLSSFLQVWCTPLGSLLEGLSSPTSSKLTDVDAAQGLALERSLARPRRRPFRWQYAVCLPSARNKVSSVQQAVNAMCRLTPHIMCLAVAACPPFSTQLLVLASRFRHDGSGKHAELSPRTHHLRPRSALSSNEVQAEPVDEPISLVLLEQAASSACNSVPHPPSPRFDPSTGLPRRHQDQHTTFIAAAVLSIRGLRPCRRREAFPSSIHRTPPSTCPQGSLGDAGTNTPLSS